MEGSQYTCLCVEANCVFEPTPRSQYGATKTRGSEIEFVLPPILGAWASCSPQLVWECLWGWLLEVPERDCRNPSAHGASLLGGHLVPTRVLGATGPCQTVFAKLCFLLRSASLCCCCILRQAINHRNILLISGPLDFLFFRCLKKLTGL